jgi:hypothetical protein
VVGSIETHDPFCRLLGEAAGVIVLSVEYRLAPEHPFPAGLNDVLAGYRWAATYAESFGGDPKRLLLGGDSAGANLAAVTANHICGTEEAAPPRGLMLLYPVTDHPSAYHGSYTENATGYGLDASLMLWFWQQYARDVSPDDPKISPLCLENVPALPPILVATAEYDPLRDEGIAYAEKLARGGIAVPKCTRRICIIIFRCILEQSSGFRSRLRPSMNLRDGCKGPCEIKKPGPLVSDYFWQRERLRENLSQLLGCRVDVVEEPVHGVAADIESPRLRPSRARASGSVS